MPQMSSMTGFGAASCEFSGARYSCEIRSLNSRYLEVQVRMPRPLAAIEPTLHQLLRQRLARGKVDLSIQLEGRAADQSRPRLNIEVAQEYLSHINMLRSISPDPSSPIDLIQVLSLEGVVQFGESTPSQLTADAPRRDAIAGLVNQAIEVLRENRAIEGETLRQILIDQCQNLNETRKSVQALQPQIQARRLRQLTDAVSQISDTLRELTKSGVNTNISHERLLQETVFLAQKTDITEEVDRLGSHISGFQDTCRSGEVVGRKLDFICQELHREVNTMSSKVDDTAATAYFVAMKQVIEQMRQQVQNVE